MRYERCSCDILVISIIILLLNGLFGSTCDGGIIYETATLAGQGRTTTVGTYVISSWAHLGARFHIDQTTQVTNIGGHLIGTQGTFFGAILELDGLDDLPSGNPINPAEVVAYDVFDYTSIFPSNDFRMPLSTILAPGDYAIVFGTNALGAMNGYGGMPFEGQVDLPGASHIYWVDTKGWQVASRCGRRFVVEGYEVPEPATMILLGLGGLAAIRRRRK